MPRSPSPTRKVALTGGIGAGKSEALEAFERGGAAVCSSDEIVHRLIAEDPEVRAALEERFGTTDRAAHRRDRLRRSATSSPGSSAAPPARRARSTWPGSTASTTASTSRSSRSRCSTRPAASALFDAVVVVTAPEEIAPGAGAAAVDAALRPADPGRREGAPRRLRLRERRLARRAGGVRRATCSTELRTVTPRRLLLVAHGRGDRGRRGRRPRR